VYDYTARHTLPQINRFRTMDPLSEKYHGISPYAFCAGDPVNRIDPTGLKDIEVDQKGEIIKNESSPSDTFDSVTVVDDKGSVVASTNIQLNSVNVIPPSESSTVKVTEYQITGVENATKVFEVLSQSEVEYGICITSPLESESTDEISTTNSTVNFITTTHQTDGESKMSGYIKSELSNKYKILEYNHSHPSNTPYPSNFKNSNGNYVGDIPVYRSLINTLGYDIKCNIFLPGTQTYVNFNPFDKKYDKK
ncbi:MAG: hypothetical protein K2K47_02675, partial [Duncaniella sp.]|nr:hypothetical protein [Duncaniella sp.]